MLECRQILVLITIYQQLKSGEKKYLDIFIYIKDNLQKIIWN